MWESFIEKGKTGKGAGLVWRRSAGNPLCSIGDVRWLGGDVARH